MGCNCGGGTAGTTIAQRARMAARQRAGSPPGFDSDTPVTLGDAVDGAEPIRVRVVRPPAAGITVGSAVWVTGTAVPALLDSGDLVDITRREQKGRLFTVGGMPYTDKGKAERVSAATGQPVMEIG